MVLLPTKLDDVITRHKNEENNECWTLILVKCQ